MNDVIYVSDFIKYLKDEKCSSNNTVQAYERDLAHFCDYIDNNHLDVLQVTSDDILRFRDKLTQNGLSNSSVCRAM